jgi:ABC-2 type transport system permease protein
MRELWLVARHEYLRMVRRRAFLLGTLAIPLLIVVVTAISVTIAIGKRDDRPLGYVDQASVLSAAVQPASGGEHVVELRAFADAQAAGDALQAGQIQAYYVLPADYLQSGQVHLYYWESAPSDTVQGQFDDFIRANLAAGLPPNVQQRAIEGSSVTIRSADGKREINSQNWVALVLPFVASFFFVMAVMTSGGYLLQAVTTEKENRTMEVMITSLTPEQLVSGKAAGLMAVSLTQIGIWTLAVVVGLIVGAQYFAPLRQAEVPWGMLGIAALYFVPSYVLVAGIMVAIGSAVTEIQQGQQIAGLINLLFFVPFFFLALVIANPDSSLLVALSLFPTTAFMTITMRWSLAVVPLWQMAVSWVLLVTSAAGSLWISARVLRAGMLRYGQRLDLHSIARALGFANGRSTSAHASRR